VEVILKAVGKHDTSKLLLETSFLGVQAPNSPNYKNTRLVKSTKNVKAEINIHENKEINCTTYKLNTPRCSMAEDSSSIISFQRCCSCCGLN
jgi:hypothetical protein